MIRGMALMTYIPQGMCLIVGFRQLWEVELSSGYNILCNMFSGDTLLIGNRSFGRGIGSENE